MVSLLLNGKTVTVDAAPEGLPCVAVAPTVTSPFRT
jgi:hypothetical protein